MRQVTYISSVKQPLSVADLKSIGLESERNNKAVGLCGVLLFDGSRFLQVLEGPGEAVQTTLERITADPRHHALVILKDKSIDALSFGEWGMLYRDVSATGESLADMVAPAVANVDKSTRWLFESFALLKSRKAA